MNVARLERAPERTAAKVDYFGTFLRVVTGGRREEDRLREALTKIAHGHSMQIEEARALAREALG